MGKQYINRINFPGIKYNTIPFLKFENNTKLRKRVCYVINASFPNILPGLQWDFSLTYGNLFHRNLCWCPKSNITFKHPHTHILKQNPILRQQDKRHFFKYAPHSPQGARKKWEQIHAGTITDFTTGNCRIGSGLHRLAENKSEGENSNGNTYAIMRCRSLRLVGVEAATRLRHQKLIVEPYKGTTGRQRTYCLILSRRKTSDDDDNGRSVRTPEIINTYYERIVCLLGRPCLLIFRADDEFRGRASVYAAK